MQHAALPIAPVQRRKVHDEVAAQLEALILSARLEAGAELPSERELMRSFGVGRPAVRQALLTLEKAGLVRVANGERTRVSRPTADGVIGQIAAPIQMMLAEPANMAHLQQARLFFEAGIARHAAEHASGPEIAAIQAACAANRDALARPEEFARTDVAFHAAIAAVTGNPIIARLGEAMQGWLTEQRLIAGRQAGAKEQSVAQHQSILQAIAARDPDRAERAMREHLADVNANYWRARARTQAKRSPA